MINSKSNVRKSLRRLFRVALLPAFALSLVVAMWVAVLVQTRSEEQSSRAEAVANSQALARILSEHVNHILRQSDHATHLYKLNYETTGGRQPLTEFSARYGLLDSVLPVRLGLPMAVVGRDGAVLDSANGFTRTSVAGEGFFDRLAGTDGNRPEVTAYRIGKGTPVTWHIQVARRLNDGEGEFAGAIILMIDPEVFVNDYDRLEIGDQGAMLLMSHTEGLTMGRAGDTLFTNDRLAFRRQRAPGASSEELLPDPPFDTVNRIFSYSELPRYGLATVVGVEASAAMLKFERHRSQYLGLAGITTLLILAVAALLMRQNAQLVASVRAAHLAQATLRAAADGSLDGVMILKAWLNEGGKVEDFRFVDINQRGAALFGRKREDLIGEKAFEMMPRYRQSGFFERYVKAYVQARPVEEEVELRLEGAEPRWIRHQIVPLADGVAVTSRDITARKNAEIEMHNNRIFLQSLIDHLPVLIYVKSLRPASMGVMMVWNKVAETVTGFAAAEVIGQVDEQVFPPDFALCNRAHDEAMLAHARVTEFPDTPLVLPDGAKRCLHSITVPLFDSEGKPEFVLCIAEDVTVRREQEASLRANEAHLTAVTNASPLGIVRTDMMGRCTYVNKRFETITGLTREQSLGHGWLGAFENDESAYMPQVFAHQRQHEEPFVRITRCTRTDGKQIWASTKIAAIRINGRIEGFIGTIDDITTLRDAELALRESEARLRTIADTLPTMIAYIDAAQVYRFHNRAYEREFAHQSGHGAGRGTMVGQTIASTIGEARYQALAPYIERALSGETLSYEESDDAAGSERIFDVTYIPQSGDDGTSVIGFHVMRQDITSQKREKSHLLKLAQIDPLTGLANRAGFMHKLGAAMAASAGGGRLMALMYMDIDHFKPVNDTYGHHVGDALLKAFSGRLVGALRATDTVARPGGDEFTIVLENLTRHEDASVLAEKIVTAMQAPFELDGVTVLVSASIGLAYFSGGKPDPDALIKAADRLLYQAKEAGRNTYRAAPAPAGGL